MLDALRPDAHDHALLAPARDAHGTRPCSARRAVDVLVRALVDERRVPVDRRASDGSPRRPRHDRDARVGQQVPLLGTAASRVEDARRRRRSRSRRPSSAAIRRLRSVVTTARWPSRRNAFWVSFSSGIRHLPPDASADDAVTMCDNHGAREQTDRLDEAGARVPRGARAHPQRHVRSGIPRRHRRAGRGVRRLGAARCARRSGGSRPRAS